MNTYDVIVVGGGPAGALLAYWLAKRDVKTLIIEKSVMPRYKVCGGGVSNKAIKKMPFDIYPLVEQDAVGSFITYQGRPLLKMETERPAAWLVMRDRFDHFLVKQAVEAGAHIVEGKTIAGIEDKDDSVTAVTKNGERYSARFLAGADGVNSIVAHSVGLLPNRKTGIALEAEVYVDQSSLKAQGAYATFDFGAVPHGYGWIFPKSDHLSTGIYYAKSGKMPTLKSYLDRFIACQPVLRNYQKMTWRGHQIPLGGDFENLHKGRVLLVGDAANLADAWMGEGISFAISSAEIAAKALVTTLQDPTVELSQYTLMVNDEIVQQLKYARTFGKLVYASPYTGSLLISKSPLMQQVVFGAIRGTYTFEEMMKLLFRRLPGILIQGIANSFKREKKK